RLERAPQAFERLYERNRFSVYAIHTPALAALRDGGTAPPFVRVARPAEPCRALGPGLPELVSFGMSRARASRGDTLGGVLEWLARTPLDPGAYHVAVRFDRAMPAGVPRAPLAFSKTWRMLIERMRGERYRFRVVN